jgi:polysaccharide export outer membrane protein
MAFLRFLAVAVLLVLPGFAGAAAAQQAPPPPVAPQAPAPVRQAADVKGYEVGSGDTLTIVIYGEKELPQEFKVAADGYINYPYIGSLKVAGMTVRGVEGAIRARLVEGKYFSDPQVVVDVLDYRSQVVQVQGQVHTPGDITLQDADMTLTKVLAKAQLTNLAGSYVEIRRRKPGADPANTSPDSFQITRVEREDLYTLKVDPRLKDGDSVFVPKSPVFYLNGFVKGVGPQVWTPGMTVGKAIANAGGLSERGTMRGLKIKRMVNGKFKDFNADENTPVLPEDQIHVRQRRF